MSTNRAKSKKRLIVFIVYPGVTLLDITGPAQVFSTANSEMSAQSMPYETIIASSGGGLVATDTGIELNTRALKDVQTAQIDTIIVAGGGGVFDATQNKEMVAWLKATMTKARRVVSTCMGVFLTAETGLIANLTVTTHWRWTDELQARHPDLDVVCEPIFVRQGWYVSTAGVTSGLDLSLTLVEEDHDRSVAMATAKNLVLYLRRTGAQSQFSSSLQMQFSDQNDKFVKLNSWIEQNLEANLSVDLLAEQVGMSPRNFSRAYTESVGCSPAKSVELMRVDKVKLMLETTKLSIKTIAHQVGFKDYERLRRTFIRHLGVSPNSYRQRFGL